MAEQTADPIIGTYLAKLKTLIAQIAEDNTRIFFYGARGTGKELFAELYSKKKKKKLFPLNCAAFSDGLLHSELFGHERGAFTGAIKKRTGILKASGGNEVIFLDEIGDASEFFQVNLLRLLHKGDYKPVGAKNFEEVHADLSLIAATSHIDKMRQELLDRFTIIYVPELKQRGDDLIELIQWFSAKHKIGFITSEALAWLRNYPWPGNVRELETVIANAYVLSKPRGGNVIKTDDLPSILYYTIPRMLYEGPLGDKAKIKIKTLKTNTQSPAQESFLRSPVNPYDGSDIQKRDNYKEEIEKLGIDTRSKEEKALDLQIKRDEHLVKILELAEKKLRRETIDDPDSIPLKQAFEKITDKEIAERFWTYHALKDRQPKDIIKLFGGKIKRDRASIKLRQAKAKPQSGKKEVS